MSPSFPRQSRRRYEGVRRPRVAAATIGGATSVDQVGAISLIALFASGGALGLFIGLWPPAGVDPAYSLTSGVAALLIAAAFWHQRRRVRTATLHVAATVGITCVVYGAYIGAGTFTGSAAPYFFGWMALFAFGVFRVRSASLYVTACAVAYAAVLVSRQVPDAAAHWVLVTGTMIASGVVVGVLRHRLNQLAMRDPLTRLPNRQCLDAALNAVAADVRRHERPAVVGVLDLNDFKAVNDEHGHERGDQLLVAFADALRGQLRRDDVVLRHGGDEFVMVLPRTDMTGAHAMLERLSLPARCAIGLTPVHSCDSPAALLRRADAQLYRAKPASRTGDQLVSIATG